MSTYKKLLSKILITGFSLFIATGLSYAQDLKINDERWAESFSLGGVDEEILSFAKDDMGNVYVGGAFSTINGVVANGISMWDGKQWHSLDGGLSSNSQAKVHAIMLIDNQVYVGGVFNAAGDVEVNNIARWDGAQWHALAGGVNGKIYAMAHDNSNNIYVGGYRISQADTVEVSAVAKWDGEKWSDMGSGLDKYADVNAIVAKNDTIYVGGTFTLEGDDPVNHIMCWDGNTWNSMNNGLNERVFSLALGNGVLYAGGRFTMAGDQTVNYLAEWDGNEWKSVDNGLNNYVYSIAFDGNGLYIGGRFTSIHGKEFNRLAKWDGISWKGYGQGMDNDVLALFIHGDELYAGGEFKLVNGKEQEHLAYWNGYKWDDSWTLQDQSVSGTVNAIVIEGDDVYVGGNFLYAGGDTVNNIAKWDGEKWTALGEGLSSGEVKALTFHNGKLYAGGNFNYSSDKTLNSIAVWDGAEWNSLSSQGINNQVYALAFHGDTLYAGGNFTSAGDIFARRVAKWDGSNWHAIGGDGSIEGAGGLDGYMNSYVTSIAVENDTVYFGGFFGRAFYQETDGNPQYISVKSIAKWDGSNWHAAPRFDEILSQQVIYDICVKDGMIYAVGEFPVSGDWPASKVVKLVDGEWLDLGEQFHNSGSDSFGTELESILEVNGNLFTAGRPDLVGESPTNYIVWWNGSEWVPLGSGVNQYVYTLASNGEKLFVGGSFSTAGGKVANKISSYYLEEFKDILSFSFEGLNPVVNATISGKKIEAVIPSGTNITALVPGIVVSESATVSPASGVAQDFSSPLVYTVTATDGTTKEYTVTVVSPSDEKEILSFEFENYNPYVIANITGTNVEVFLPPGTDITAQIPTTIKVSDGATVSPAEGIVQDFSSPIVYTVTAADGSTKDFTVSATVLVSDENEMISFSFENLNPVVNAIITDTNVEITVPSGTDITTLTPTIAVSELATVSPASGVIQDFTSPVVYTVTAEDGSVQEYTVTVAIVLSDAREVISFSFDGLDPVVEATFSGFRIELLVPSNTDLTELVPTIEVSASATVYPESGIARDFSSTVYYTVTAENGSTARYYVYVTKSGGEKEMISFVFEELTPPVSATFSGFKVYPVVPANTDVTSLVPTIEISDLATVSPASGVAQDFTSAVDYTVTAEDGSYNIYTVVVWFAPSDENELLSFVFESLDPAVSATITGTEVKLVVPFGTDRSALIPTIEVSDLASIYPASGVAQDFSSQLVYTVTAENGDKKNYTVEVEVSEESTGIPGKEMENEFSISPNPASTIIYLSTAQSIEIFSAKGLLLKAIENANVIQISELAPGVYIIRNSRGDTKKLLVY